MALAAPQQMLHGGDATWCYDKLQLPASFPPFKTIQIPKALFVLCLCDVEEAQVKPGLQFEVNCRESEWERADPWLPCPSDRALGN